VKVTKSSTSALGQYKSLEQNFGPCGASLAVGSKIAGNAIIQCFIKKFTMVIYGIGIGCIRYL
jgi:hypothetical protein